MNFDIQDLQLFLKIADTGSLTQGAKERARSLSAASSRLRSLEDQLGARLFYREPNGLTLTSAGETLLVHARKIVNEYELTRAHFSVREPKGRSRLRILANAASISEIVPDLVIALLGRDSDVNVDVYPRNAKQAVKGVLDHEADVALITGNEDLCGLNSVLFTTDHLAVVFPEGHPLSAIAKPKLREIVEFPLLSIYGSTLIDFLQEHIRSAGLQAQYRVLLDSFEPMTRLVEANAGVAIIPESTALRLCAKYKVRTLKVDEDWAVRQRRAIFGDFAFLSMPARELLGILIEMYFPVQPGSVRLEEMVEPQRDSF